MCDIILSKDEGYSIQLHDEEIKLHGATICFCGDIPASNYIGEYKEGVGFSL